MKAIHLNLQSLRDLSLAVSRFLGALPYVFLIQRFMWVRLVMLLGLLLGALWVIMALLYLNLAATATEEAARPLVLDKDTIDELEEWLEGRQGERERPIVNRQREYFR